MAKTQSLLVNFGHGEYEELRGLSDDTGRSMTGIVREAVRNYIADQRATMCLQARAEQWIQARMRQGLSREEALEALGDGKP